MNGCPFRNVFVTTSIKQLLKKETGADSRKYIAKTESRLPVSTQREGTEKKQS